MFHMKHSLLHHNGLLTSWQRINRYDMAHDFEDNNVPIEYVNVTRINNRTFKEQWEYDNDLFRLLFIDKLPYNDIVNVFPDMNPNTLSQIRTGKSRKKAVTCWCDYHGYNISFIYTHGKISKKYQYQTRTHKLK